MYCLLIVVGKHIAVIYPPACSMDWLLQSRCYSELIDFTNVNHSVRGVEDARRAKKHVVLSTYTTQGVPVAAPIPFDRPNNALRVRGFPRNRVKFIIANRLDSDKCPALLLMAIKYIRDSLTELELHEFDSLAQFDFYGGGPLLRSLRDMSVALGLQQLVSFRGAVSESELISAMRYSSVLINPKVVGETFGFVHTEAGVMGVPVIAFRSGANAETVSTGVLIDPNSQTLVEDLAIAIVAYYQKFSSDSFNEEDSFCVAAKSRIAQWNIHRHSDSLMDAVTAVLV